jgi:hypothetical protein
LFEKEEKKNLHDHFSNIILGVDSQKCIFELDYMAVFLKENNIFIKTLAILIRTLHSTYQFSKTISARELPLTHFAPLFF